MENIKGKPYLIHTVMVRHVKHMYVALLKSPKTRQQGIISWAEAEPFLIFLKFLLFALKLG